MRVELPIWQEANEILDVVGRRRTAWSVQR
jgi:hypothetical protein